MQLQYSHSDSCLHRQCDGRTSHAAASAIRIKALLLPACLLVAGMLCFSCAPQESVAELYRQATHLADDADFEEALELTEACLQRDPDHVKSLILHGYCHYRLMAPGQMSEDPSPVMTYIEKAARLAPDNFLAQYFKGWMLYEADEFGRALEPLERAYELREQNPEHLDSLLVMLSACCVEQNLNRGRTYLQALRRFRGFERSPLVYNAIGVLNVKQLDYGSALESFLEAVERDPDHPVVLQNLAVLYDDLLQQHDEAMRYYIRAIGARQRMRDSTHQEAIKRRLRQLAAQRRQPAAP